MKILAIYPRAGKLQAIETIPPLGLAWITAVLRIYADSRNLDDLSMPARDLLIMEKYKTNQNQTDYHDLNGVIDCCFLNYNRWK
jgi:hypothetical protein